MLLAWCTTAGTALFCIPAPCQHKSILIIWWSWDGYVTWARAGSWVCILFSWQPDIERNSHCFVSTVKGTFLVQSLFGCSLEMDHLLVGEDWPGLMMPFAPYRNWLYRDNFSLRDSCSLYSSFHWCTWVLFALNVKVKISRGFVEVEHQWMP